MIRVERIVRWVLILAVVLAACLAVNYISGDGNPRIGASVSNTNTPDGKWHEDDAPGCIMEPSDTTEGYEIIRYEHLWQDDDYEGFQVPCPGGQDGTVR